MDECHEYVKNTFVLSSFRVILRLFFELYKVLNLPQVGNLREVVQSHYQVKKVLFVHS